MSDETLANLSHEERRFEPSADFAKQANLTEDAYDEAEKDRLAFWEKQAERLDWDTKWDQVLDWDDPPFAKWFVGGKINAAYNCVDRHVENGAGDKVAFHWEGEPEDDTRDITYGELKDEVCKAANALVELGVETGDRVAIYMPMIPETVIAMLACARIGAPHTVVFGGFSSDALANRVEDCDAQVVITADGGYRRGAPSALKPAVDEAAEKSGTSSARCWWSVVRARTWSGTTSGTCGGTSSSTASPPTTSASSSTPSTRSTSCTPPARPGSPRGSCTPRAGYLVGCAYTHWGIFDLKPDDDVYWCTADVGWVTGHSYGVYGPLANQATSVMYEGTPDTPHKGRWWEICEKYGVTIFYTAPTAIRTFMKWGDEIPDQARPVQAAGARLGRRTDQPGGLRLVPQDHRR